jgi:hypothetical protein
MEIRLHIGVHRAATKHLRSILELNHDLLDAQGICLPEPASAERAFANAIKKMNINTPILEVKDALLSELTQDKEYQRIVMIDPNISGTMLRPIGKEYFYPRISTTISRIISALDGMPLRLFVGLRNPATFVPSCYSAGVRTSPEISFAAFVSEANLQGLRWSISCIVCN